MKIVKKIIFILIGIVLILVISTFAEKKIYEMRFNSISKDITIEYNTDLDFSGGIASTTYITYIDIGEKSLYTYEDYYIYGKAPFFMKGDHEKIRHTQDLSEEEINHIISVFENSSNITGEIEEKSDEPIVDNETGTVVDAKTIIKESKWFQVTYKGETKYISKDDSDDLYKYAKNINYGRNLP